jgi:hypothetical protein
MSRHLLAPCLLLLALPLVLHAEPAPPEDPALTALRTSHQAALKLRVEAATKKQLEALKALEAERVEKEDYTGADQVAQELAALEKISAAAAVKTPGTILDIRIPHSLSYGANEKNSVIVLTKTNGAVRWEGLNLTPGLYQVKMTYSVDAPAAGTRMSIGPSGRMLEIPVYGGTVTFSESTSINGSKALDYVVPRTTGMVEKTTVDLGFITTTSSRTTLILKAKDALSEGLMTLHNLELIPTAPVTETKAVVDGKELASLEEEFRKQIREKTASGHKAWLAKLQELAKAAAASSNTAALTAIQPELDRVTKLVNPTSTLPAAGQATVILNAFDPLMATMNGEIRLSTTKDCLQRLRPVGARVSFKLASAKVQPGAYRVTLNVNEGPGTGGGYVLSCGGNQISGTLEGSNALVHRSLTVSKSLIIPANATYLEFSVESLMNASTGSLCELSSIELTPEKTAP